MAGGNWITQNKVRPGAYINFKGVAKPLLSVGDRGIVTLAMPLTWGKECELNEVLSSDMLTGDSLHKVGCSATDSGEDALVLSLALTGCYKALVFRLNSGGEIATATIGEMTVTAKHSGTSGNKITVSVIGENGKYIVKTFFDAVLKNTQTVAEIEQLKANDFVVFAGTGSLENNAGTPLLGGTNGTVNAASAYPQYFYALKKARFQCGAIVQDCEIANPLAYEFVKHMRDELGKKIQFVLNNYTAADCHGVINSVNGIKLGQREVAAPLFCAYVASITAGSPANKSNTYRVVEGATEVIDLLDSEDIEEAIKAGELVLSHRQDGAVVVEQDINSHHTFVPDKGYAFSKNRVVRVLDEIAVSIADIWEKSYVGKVSNNETGRAMFKNDIIAYLTELTRIEAISEFKGADDVEVNLGSAIDSVAVNIDIMPVDSMEKLYMTVNVGG